MNKRKLPGTDSASLRQRAEILLKAKLAAGAAELSLADTLKLIHELEVHQVELELQNEELLRAFMAAEDSAEKYNELYDFAPLGYFTLSKDALILDLNLSGCEMLGSERSRLKNRSFIVFISHDTKAVFEIFLQKIFSDAAKQSCEVTLSVKGKMPMYVYLTGIASQNGEECLLTVVDESKLREAEELRKNAEQYRSVTKSANDAIISTNRKGLILDWNRGAERIFGYTEDEINGKNLATIIPRNFIKQYISEISPDSQGSVSQLKGKTVELFGSHKNGNEIPIELSWSEWETSAGKFYTGIIRDITERKQAEMDLIRSKEKAEESDRLKSAFLANMSHEIRTPMNGILGFTSMLREPDISREEMYNYIHIIENSGARLLNIIDDVVDISKIESGQMPVSIAETNVSELVEDIYSFFRREVEQKGLKIFYKTASLGNRAIILTDAVKLYAILTNLVKNSIKFTYEGSIEFGYKLKGDFLEFFVKDTGIGISAEQQDFIFDRFRQGSESLSRNYEGAGLGLSISRAYVEMLGGKIWLESETGKGSVFSFTIPYRAVARNEEASKKSVLAQEAEDPVKDLKILIAEDDETSELFVSMAVQAISREILIVRNGRDAVETCRLHPDIDLVLMDMKMPGIDGYDATRQIRLFNSDVIIIAQTAFGLGGDSEKAIDAGCNAYISKPLTLAVLHKLIQKHLGKNTG